MSWFRWLTPRPKEIRQRQRVTTVELAEAMDATITAERKLAEAQKLGTEVSQVVETARRLRRANNFSTRIGHLFEGD